ncbi:hypothetical protein ACHAXT_001545 [Thalassiosira profunda]
MAAVTRHSVWRGLERLGGSVVSSPTAAAAWPLWIPQNININITSGRTLATGGSAHVDTLIIGGGPVGLSTAFHLASEHRGGDGSDIVVVEKDPSYAKSSATLSAGGIRQQFSLKENVEMSLYGRDFLRDAHNLLKVDDEEVDVQFQEHGYLFLAASEAGKQQLVENNTVQQAAGCDVHLMDQTQLEERFPWLNTNDILLGSFGESGEGWFDPWALIRNLRRKCQSMGVRLVTGYPTGATRDRPSGRVRSVHVLEDGNDVQYHPRNVVNAAGAYCNDVMTTLAGGDRPLRYPIPVEPRKRCIFHFHCNTEQTDAIVPQIAPLTVCPTTGVYFRSEGLVRDDGVPTGNFLCGVSPKQEFDRAIVDERDLDYADHELWEEVLWPAIYNRCGAFGDTKLKSSWAGLYEYNTVDQNSIIDFHPEMDNVLMVNGFSGHGLQQSPASGRAAAELISYGEFSSLDLSIFSFERCCENTRSSPVFEAGIV